MNTTHPAQPAPPAARAPRRPTTPPSGGRALPLLALTLGLLAAVSLNACDRSPDLLSGANAGPVEGGAPIGRPDELSSDGHHVAVDGSSPGAADPAGLNDPDGPDGDARAGAPGPGDGRGQTGGTEPLGVHRERDGVRWLEISLWRTVQSPSTMRLATQRLGPEPSPFDSGECVLYRFPGGGDPQSNIQRWIGQFSGPDGGMPLAEQAERAIGGHPAWWVRASGTWTTQDPPMSGPERQVADHAMIGAVIIGPGDPVFVRCTGPVERLAQQDSLIRQFFESIRVER